MPGKHFDLDTDVLLGGENSSDITIASQKATKSYIDTKNSAKQDKLTAGQNIKIENNVISVDGISAELSELSDTTITNPTNGQGLLYNGTTEKWENKTIDIPSKTSDLTNDSGFITKSVNNLENYTTTTDLNTALSGKADSEHEHTVSDITDFPTNVSAFTNDVGYLTEHQDITGKQDVIDASHKLSSDLVDDTNKTHKFVTAEEKTTWNEKQDSISDLATIRSGAEKGATAVQPTDLAEVATSGDYTDLSNTPVNVSEFTNDAGYLTSQDISSVFVYKGTKATVAELPATGNKQGDVWTVTEDGSEYVWDGTKWEYLGEVLDLSGYQTLITSTNKLGADLVDDSTSTNKFVTASDKTTWSNKQDAISDLADIREGAGKGATAVQPDDLADVATSGAYSDLTGTPTNVSEFTNDAGYLTAHQDISGKQDVISDLSTIRENAQAGKEASDTIATYGDIVSHNADEFLTEHQDISGKQDVIDANHKLSADLLSEGTTNKLVSANEKATWSGKQDALTQTQLDNITAAGTALQPNDNISELNNDAGYLTAHQDISGKADKATTLSGYGITDAYTKTEIDGKLTGAMHYKGTVATVAALDNISTKETGDVYNVTETGDNYAWDGTKWDKLSGVVDLSGYVPTSRKVNGKTLTGDITLNASDVSALPADTAIPSKTSDITNDSGFITANDIPTNLSAFTDDLGTNPVHTHNQYLTEHQDISGKQDVIDATHKLSADLLSEGTTNKLVSASEKSTWNGKQNAISDLETIRANATAGKSAKDAVDAMGDIVSHDADEFQVAGDYAAEIHTHAISDVTDLQTTLNGKQATISDLADIRSGAELGSTAVQPSAISDMATKTWVGQQNYLTEHQDISGKQDVITDLTTIRNNAQSGADAATTIAGYGDIVTHNANEFLTEHQSLDGKQDKITSTNKLSSDLIDDTNKTHKFVTSAEKTTWNNKQDAINDLANIRSGATAGSTALQPNDNVSELTNDAGYLVTSDISGKADASNVYTKTEIDGKLTGAMHFKGTVATVSALPATAEQGDMYNVTETGANYAWDGSKWDKLSENIDLSGLQEKITASNKLNADWVDDTSSTNKFVTSTEKSTWSGKQNEITSSNKLSADLLSEGTTNKLVSATEKSTWDAKQDSISDLADIRSNAQAGKDASDTIETYGDVVTHDASEFAGATHSHAISDVTNLQTTLNGKQNEITSTNKLSADLLSEGTNNKLVSATEKSTWNSKLDSSAIADMATQTWVGEQGYLTSHQDISGKQDKITNTNKLSADLLSEGTTNKLVSSTEKSTWNGKQDALSSTQISNIAKGGTAVQPGDLADVATSGSYNDLTDKPSIPSAVTESTVSGWGFTKNTGTVTKVNNVSPVNGNVTISIPTVPTNVSAFTNDAGYLTSHQSLADYTKTEDLGAVALSNSYNDLDDKPTIPAAQVNSDWNATSGKAQILNKPSIPSQASDIGAAEASHNHTSSEITDLSATINSAISGKADSATSLSGYGITDAYTKSEIDGMVASGMHYKGTKASASALPTTGNAVGDLWNVTDTGANYAWNGTAWDKLSENIDLSGYVPTSRKVNGKALTGNISLTASDVGALPSSTAIPTKTSDLTNDDGFITGITSSDVTTALGFTPYNSTNPNGYTSNTGTITGIKMNGASKGTSGVVDLGTVITEHQSLAGYQTLLSASNKLNPSYINTSASNRFVTDTEKSTWNGKQDAISDLSTIRSGAGAGATALQPEDNISELTNDAGYITSSALSGYQTTLSSTNKLNPAYINTSANYRFVTDTEKTTWNGKQDTISDLSTIRTNAANGASAYTTISGYGTVVTHDASEFALASHNQATSTINALTGYTKPATTSALAATDTLNQALGKLEKGLESITSAITVGMLSANDNAGE